MTTELFNFFMVMFRRWQHLIYGYFKGYFKGCFNTEIVSSDLRRKIFLLNVVSEHNVGSDYVAMAM